LLTTELKGEERHLFRRPLGAAEALDLGKVELYPDPFVLGDVVSADAQEALIRRDREIVAIKLDGTGQRTIVSDDRSTAAFLSGHDVLYVEGKNLMPPEQDVPEYVFALGLLRGEQRVALADHAECSITLLSRSKRLVVRACHDGVHIYSLDAARELRAIAHAATMESWLMPVGFDDNDAGLVVAIGTDTSTSNAQHELRFLGLDGRDRTLGRAHTLVGANGHTGWPSFALRPKR
jgi:hypothetical protein